MSRLQLVPLEDVAGDADSWWRGDLCERCDAKFAATPPHWYFASKRCTEFKECGNHIFGSGGALCRACARGMSRCWSCGGDVVVR